LVFNKKNEEYEKISLEPYSNVDIRFYAATIYGDRLFLFPESISTRIKNPYFVIQVDLTGGGSVCLNNLDLMIPPTEGIYRKVFSSKLHVNEELCYILLQKTNSLIEYNLESNIWNIYEVGKKDNMYSTMFVVENIFYLVNQDGNVTIWNREENRCNEYINKIQKYAVDNKNSFEAFSSSIEFQNKIYFIPAFANSVISFDGLKISEATFSSRLFESEKRMELGETNGCYLCTFLKGNKLYVWSLFSYKFFVIQMDCNEVECKLIETRFDDKELDQLYIDFKKCMPDAYEENISNFSDLYYYLKRLSSKNRFKNSSIEEDSVGKKVLYKVMM